MIRFINLTKDYSTDYENPIHMFAFLNTVTNRFFEFSGDQTWGRWIDFAADYHAEPSTIYPIERFLSLIPQNVPKDWIVG